MRVRTTQLDLQHSLELLQDLLVWKSPPRFVSLNDRQELIDFRGQVFLGPLELVAAVADGLCDT